MARPPGALLLLLAALTVVWTAQAKPASIKGFSLADVQLAAGSEFAANFEQNNRYLLALDPDNLLFNFRKNAGMPAPGESYGGWEWETVEVRGQFMGHYLSALAFAAQNTGRPEFLARSQLMVEQLSAVQDALGTGFLAAFPDSHFDRLEALQPVWAPYYVIHKMMAGLLDQATLVNQPPGKALSMVGRMADYFCGRVKNVLAVNGTDHWHQVLENEFGGMNEVLYNLFSVTKNQSHAECAHWFDKPAFLGPLLEGKDPLPWLHANTHLAQVQGFAARYEHVGDPQGLAATAHFLALVLQHHSFSTGGSNWWEHWGAEDSLGSALNETNPASNTEESCTQYNILKIARQLFRHTGEPALADFYERAILNDVIGIQKLQANPQQLQHGHSHSHSHSHSHGLAHGGSHSHSHGDSQGGRLSLLPIDGGASSSTDGSLQEGSGEDSVGQGGALAEGGSEGSLQKGGSGKGGKGCKHGGRKGGGKGEHGGGRDSHNRDHARSFDLDHRTHIRIHTSHMHRNASVHIHIHVHNDDHGQQANGGHDTGVPDANSPPGGGGPGGDSATARRRLRRSLAVKWSDEQAAALGLEEGAEGQQRAEREEQQQEAGDVEQPAPLTRPANYKIVSWPEEPALAHRRPPADEPIEGGPGVFIYYLPLGAGLDKNTGGTAWTRGWGDPWNSFWCCYGTAVESFSKLADSIYFHQTPPGPPPGAPQADAASSHSSDASGAAAGTGAAAAASSQQQQGEGDGAPPVAVLPTVYVNQLVPSSLRWRELHLVMRQEADLYGPKTAGVSRVTFDIYPPDQALPWVKPDLPAGGTVLGGEDGGGGQGPASAWVPSAGGKEGQHAEQRRFVLKWRIPGWAKAPEVQIKINGANYTQCTPTPAEEGPMAGAQGAQEEEAAGSVGAPPRFASGARYCSIARVWTNGDVVEAFMPMKVWAEDVRDSRPEFRSLKAIMMGPFLMAGLSHGDRNLSADPAKLADAMSLPDASGLVSLALPPPAGPFAKPADGGEPADSSQRAQPSGQRPKARLLHHCAGSVQLGGVCAATGTAAPLDATFRLASPLAGCPGGDCSAGAVRRLLMRQEQQGEGLLRAEDGDGSGGGKPSVPRVVSFEAASAPGQYLTADAASGQLVLRPAAGSGSGDAAVAQTFRLHAVSPGGDLEGAQAGGQQGTFELEPLSQPGRRVHAETDSSVLRVQQAGSSSPAAFLLAPPAAPAFPRGTRVLHGGNRDYLLVPLGQIMDEPYTAYFDFQAGGGSGRKAGGAGKQQADG